MNPRKKSRRCRGLGLDSGLDLAISRFIYSFAPPHLHTLALAQWFCRGRFSRPPSQDAGRFFSPACILMKRQSGGGAPVEDRIVIYLNIIFVICVSLLWRQ